MPRSELERYRDNGFLVFDVRRLAGGSDVRIGNGCPQRMNAPRCVASQRLELGELGVWRTVRMPLAALGMAPLSPRGAQWPAFVIESQGAATELLLADVRWEAYPKGQWHARPCALLGRLRPALRALS